MTDLSGIPDDQLLGMLNQQGGSPLAGMSDTDLMKALGQQSSIGADVAKSAGIGLVKGGLGLAELPGAARELVGSGIKYLGGKLGLPEPPAGIENAAPNIIPRPGAVTGALESVTGPLYQPQTVPGEFAQTAGEFAPGLLGGAPGLARRAIGQVALPAVASETAGQATKGTAAEPYARLGGALAGGVAGALQRAPEAVLPTAVEAKAAAKALYKSPEVSTLEIAPKSVSNLAIKIEDDLVKQGFRPRTAPGAFEETRGMAPGPGVKSVNVDDLDAVRKSLGKDAKELDIKGQPTEAATAAKIAIRHIDDYLTTPFKPSEIIAGDAAAANRALLQARANYASGSRAQEVDFRLSQSERQAAKSGSGSNIENARRQKIDKVSDYGLTAAERAKKEEIVLGTTGRNALRKFGKLGASDGLSLLLHAGLAAGTGGASLPFQIPVMTAGTIARKVGEGLTKRSIKDLNQQILNRSPLAQQMQALQQLAGTQSPAQLNPGVAGLFGALLAAQSPGGLLGNIPVPVR